MEMRLKRIAGLFLAAVLSVGTVCSAGAVTIDEAEKKADELEEQKDAAESEKSELSQKLDEIISEMEKTKAQLEEKEAQIEAAEAELVQAKIDENEQYESMKVRIRFMYEGGNSQLMELLLTSENMGEFLNKAEYISRISEYDRNELIKYQDTVKQVEEKETKLQSEYNDLNTLQTQLVDQQTNVEALLAENAEKLSDIETQIEENKATLEDLKEKAAEAERLRQEQLNQQNQSNNIFTESNSENVVSGNGYFTHPCPGMTYQSSYFGEIRPYEVGGHKGHDYAAPTGTPTYAAAAGTVIIAGYSASAGNWVVINHGNGLTTKYMHHSALCVTAGQYVEKGQQIGYVGNTGQSTGPHLHFQVEENGVAVNPDKYL